MLQKFIHFIKYHNAFTISLALIFVLGASAFANEGVRDAIIGEKIVKEQGIDNSQLLAANLSSFNFGLQITNIQEDTGNYYIAYSHQTWIVTNNTWQPGNKEKQIIVSKAGLGNNDLGLYLAEELGEVADSEIKYLKEVQEIEKKNGLQQKIVSVDYTGLMGLALDIKNKVFPNYNPVVVIEPPKPETIYQPEPQLPLTNQAPPPAIQNTVEPAQQLLVDKELIQQIVAELLAQQTGDQISNIIVSDITHNSAKITWDTSKDSSTILEYGLSAGPAYNSSISGTTAAKGNIFLHTVNLTGLESDTVHHFRVISLDKNGIKAESQDMIFKTLPFQQIIQPQPEPESEPEPEPVTETPPASSSEPPLPEPPPASESEPTITP